MSEHEVKIARGLDALPEALGSARRVLVITGPSRRFVERLPLEDREVEVFDAARVHVPREVLDAASAALARFGADAIVALGGGAAIGLGKALCLVHAGLRFVAIPTTYSGSEMTSIHGVTDGGDKRTGRDPRARPHAVIHEPALFTEMPRALTVTSLLNALAHPIGALEGGLDEGAERAALGAIRDLSWALDQLLESASSADGLESALRGAARAGEIIERGGLGVHHAVAHLLGGRFDLDHAGVHAVLLPHTARRLADEEPALYARIADAAGASDLPARLYDALTRAGTARSLVELGVAHEAFEALAAEDPRAALGWVDDARLGRRPTVRSRALDAGARPWTLALGPPPREASRVIVALHGRGANAGRFAKDVLDLSGRDPSIAIVAPQAPRCAWFEGSFRAPESGLEASLDAVRATLDALLAEGVAPERTSLVGFSQGACLAIECVARAERRLGGLVAIAGGRIGATPAPIARELAGLPVVLGAAEGDSWVRPDEVEAAASALRAAGARVTVIAEPGDAHVITLRQRVAAHALITGRDPREGLFGLHAPHQSEALEGALPRHQNTPRKTTYGLYPELVSGTGFMADRHHNRRVWLYRIRPSASHTPFEPLAHATFRADWTPGEVDPNLAGWAALPAPEAPTDFVDGVATLGGQGSPALRRGFAIHLYAANRSMERRAFYDADGDLLIIPQEGSLTLQTELGVLDVGPGQIALVPRGLKLAVHLAGGFARGWIGEAYGRSFELPARGVVGSNGTSDPRHFRAPRAWFEDRVVPGYRLTAKLGNALHDARLDHSPFDVVAWHGEHAPYVYELADFSPVGNTRFDHPDPSVHVVIGAPMDEAGADTLDFVFFPPRWDPTEHTFRPPFFHRNAVTELNGIIADPSLRAGGPFAPGVTFLTPSMTAHGVLARAVESQLRKPDAVADRPARIPDASAWFQLETMLPLSLTPWARAAAHRIGEWPHVWGAYRERFEAP
ncbi:MAG: homogentisate 1,2-dioxygenase [Sandaracinaceae bacterium]|nr:homogentisate 1,2-dioxygenase [Sandaracinaceae bacterium]